MSVGNPKRGGLNAAGHTIDRYDEMKVVRSRGVMLVDPLKVTDDMKIYGYAIQIIATRSGIPPGRAYMEKFSDEIVKMTRGNDGLDRYYIREYDSLRKAVREMQKLHNRGVDDVFVRALAEYDRF